MSRKHMRAAQAKTGHWLQIGVLAVIVLFNAKEVFAPHFFNGIKIDICQMLVPYIAISYLLTGFFFLRHEKKGE